MHTKGTIKHSPIFSEYWKFAQKRQELFYKKIGGPKNDFEAEPDPILNQYKFTNCYRATDRVSQYLIKNVIYSGTYSPEDTFLRIIVFKTFNKIETWEFLESQVGVITCQSFNPSYFSYLLHERISKKQKVYSAAYIMPSGTSTFGFDRKHDNHLALIERMLKDGLHETIWTLKSLSEIYEALLKYPMIGPFLAMQYAIDLCYSQFTEAKESEFIVAGPGAIRGIKKCFDNINGYSTSDVIKYMTENQEYYFSMYNLEFSYLKNRKLQLIDCQNLFCEFDKYCRAKFPEIAVGNKRIKQMYSPNTQPIEYFFPPKWGCSIS